MHVPTILGLLTLVALVYGAPIESTTITSLQEETTMTNVNAETTIKSQPWTGYEKNHLNYAISSSKRAKYEATKGFYELCSTNGISETLCTEVFNAFRHEGTMYIPHILLGHVEEVDICEGKLETLQKVYSVMAASLDCLVAMLAVDGSASLFDQENLTVTARSLKDHIVSITNDNSISLIGAPVPDISQNLSEVMKVLAAIADRTDEIRINILEPFLQC